VSLLSEYAITPDVFDVASYSGEEACGLYLDKLRVPLEYEAVVRDLRRGEWFAQFSQNSGRWHRSVKDLLKKLNRDGRLVHGEPALASSPIEPFGWCEEAIGSHNQSELSGVVTTRVSAERFRYNKIVASIESLAGSSWWRLQRPSERVARTIAAYKQELNPFLRHANSLMFIDPHLDPSKPRYSKFFELIEAIGPRRPPPRIEIHRVCYRGSPPNRMILSASDVEAVFRPSLAPVLTANGLTAEIFMWDDFHYRFLITNFGGLLLENGLDTSTSPRATTIWTWVSREVSDDVLREFDPQYGRHALRHRFTLP
jgi:hypothetical protein